MTAPLILAFCAPGDVERVTAARDAACAPRGPGHRPAIGFDPGALGSWKPRILLGVGPAGCASLAAYVAERGLEGVAAVVLVEPAAPLAKLSAQGHSLYQSLGPLEPLCAAAERAREQLRCYGEWLGGSGGHKRFGGCGKPAVYVSEDDPEQADREPQCEECYRRLSEGVRSLWWPYRRLKVIVACCPEAPPCDACVGSGQRHTKLDDGTRVIAACNHCRTGRMLSSAEVADELAGRVRPDETGFSQVFGGLSIIEYSTRASLLAHGLEAALRAAMEEQ